MEFHNRLYFERHKSGLSADSVAKRLDMPTSTYYTYERGKHKPPYDKLVALCDLFNVTADYMLGRTER